jgi:hypothetical protein
MAAPLAVQAHPADQVCAERHQKDVAKLVSIGTRHTLSSQTDPARGIGVAVDWGLEEFRRIGASCGGCLEVLPVGETVTGPRIPTPTLVRNALALPLVPSLSKHRSFFNAPGKSKVQPFDKLRANG